MCCHPEFILPHPGIKKDPKSHGYTGDGMPSSHSWLMATLYGFQCKEYSEVVCYCLVPHLDPDIPWSFPIHLIPRADPSVSHIWIPWAIQIRAILMVILMSYRWGVNVMKLLAYSELKPLKCPRTPFYCLSPMLLYSHSVIYVLAYFYILSLWKPPSRMQP